MDDRQIAIKYIKGLADFLEVKIDGEVYHNIYRRIKQALKEARDDERSKYI